MYTNDAGRGFHRGGCPMGVHHTRLAVPSDGGDLPAPPALHPTSHLSDPVITGVSNINVVVRIDTDALRAGEACILSESIQVPRTLTAATHSDDLSSLKGHLAYAVTVDDEEVVVAIEGKGANGGESCRFTGGVTVCRSTACHKCHLAAVAVDFVQFIISGNEEASHLTATQGPWCFRELTKHPNNLTFEVEETNLITSCHRLPALLSITRFSLNSTGARPNVQPSQIRTESKTSITSKAAGEKALRRSSKPSGRSVSATSQCGDERRRTRNAGRCCTHLATDLGR
mmetsp:Transcript_368/g.765  ORF Transcript_368/g.765 Transcript_368/m.765 type:complete len:286 (-) Transcript_368:101-958(-)